MPEMIKAILDYMGKDVMITLIGIFIGALLAFSAQISAQIILKWIKNRRVRKAIKIEMKYNKDSLITFWDNASEKPSEEEECDDSKTFEIQPFDCPRFIKFVEDAPCWGVNVWNSSAYNAAVAFKSKDFKKIYTFYQNLPRVLATYNKIWKADDTKLRTDIWIKLVHIIAETISLTNSMSVK